MLLLANLQFVLLQESPTLSHGSRTPPIGSGNVQKVKARLEKTKKIQLPSMLGRLYLSAVKGT